MQKQVVVTQSAVANINGNQCINCGWCEEACPTKAISEHQKVICHVCPDCTTKPALTLSAMKELQKTACTIACPLGLSPQAYINLLRCGKEKEAFEVIFAKNPLPTVCGFVCHHPCEESCKRGIIVDEPMKIRALKRNLGERFIDMKATVYPKLYDKHVAVIGAGPAGITAAHLLLKRGYQVTLFEQGAEPGGMLIRGIPSFRLDKSMVRKEIARLQEAGMDIQCNARITNLDELRKDFDKIIVATGTQVSKTLKIPGWRTNGIHLAVNFMEQINAGLRVKVNGNVVVIGGGSVAVDTARAALRNGAEQVTVISLESGENIPAHSWEIEEAKEEGIQFIEGVAPVEYLSLGNDGHQLSGIKIVSIENLDTKTFHYDTVAGSETVLKADHAIVAIGQKSDTQWADDVVLAGDIAGGKCSVIDAMASGRMAALAVDKELAGREFKDYEVERELAVGEKKYKIYPGIHKAEYAGNYQWPQIEKLDKDKAVKNFEPVEQNLDDEAALLETHRCLQCGYRKVNTEQCIGCGVCMRICPKGDVITMIPVAENSKEVK